MRTLCVAEAYPWPPRGGYELRLVHQIAAMASLGDVDMLCLDGSDRPRDPAPPGVRVLDAPEGPERSARVWLPRWLRSSLPRRLVRRDFDRARSLIADLLEASYDAALYCHVDAWLATHEFVRAPAIVDFDNLENLAIRGRRATGPTLDPSRSAFARAVATMRWQLVMVIDRVDERRWDRIQRRAAAQASRTLVCSELDVVRSGVANAVCVPNGYELPGAPVVVERAGREPAELARAPVMLFVGMLLYEPNSDAARWFAIEVFPLVRRSMPAAQFRIVGRNPEGLAELGALDGVELVGPVDDLAEELAGADISVVPIRFGAGTRLKVVEAMANRLPLVSTSLGCEGIEVCDGVELLIADDAASFADACLRLATEPEVRESLTAAAYDRFDTTYRWSTIRADLAELVRQVSADSR